MTKKALKKFQRFILNNFFIFLEMKLNARDGTER